MASIMPVSNETKSSMTRVTKEGRQLTYEMSVIQQPERARACGSGAKSSADRRPVDPPPVVELRIYEGEAKNDITFSYNANFFLYTTLENARPIAQGRVPTAQTSFPVLTGMPVAGMAYLDRPSPAGYFIFPDLSVRHEGKYRLSFNLFEELKEAKDADADSATGSPESEDAKPLRNNPMAPQAHVHFRLEVKSVPFNVYSAKKFPGLAESTSLSRIVAEQGCRVRIRRDVRMRRRDTKSNKNYEDYEDEPAQYARSDRYATPDAYSKSQIPDRPRSISNGIDTPTNFATDQRRQSMQEMAYYNQTNNYQQAPQPAPQPQSASAGYTSHLSFGSSGAPHHQTTAFQPPITPAPQPAQNYLPSNNGYQYSNPVHSRQVSNPQNGGYNQNPAPQPPVYSQSQMYSDNNEYRPVQDYRRTSAPATNQGGYSSQNTNGYGPVDNRNVSMSQNYYPPVQHVQPPAPRVVTPSNGHELPPLKTLQPPMEKKYEPISPATAIPGAMIGISPAYDNMPNKYPSYAVTPQPANPGTARNTKRAFGAVFNSDHINQPMHSGMRPSSSSVGQDVPQIEAEDGTLEDEYDMQSLKMLAYRRADGSRQLKKCPSPISE